MVSDMFQCMLELFLHQHYFSFFCSAFNTAFNTAFNVMPLEESVGNNLTMANNLVKVPLKHGFNLTGVTCLVGRRKANKKSVQHLHYTLLH